MLAPVTSPMFDAAGDAPRSMPISLIAGSGFATVVYENRFGLSDTRLGGYQWEINGAASTPEPSSMILVSSGVVWLVRRGRKA